MTRLGTILGGVAGFVIVLGLGLALGRSWERSIISGAIAALAFGFMARWWMMLWLTSLQSAQVEQAQQQALAVEAAAQEAAETPEEEPAP
jgi:hypothetical protein